MSCKYINLLIDKYFEKHPVHKTENCRGRKRKFQFAPLRRHLSQEYQSQITCPSQCDLRNKSHTKWRTFIYDDLLQSLDSDSVAWYLNSTFRTLVKDDRRLRMAIMIVHSRKQCKLRCSFEPLENQESARLASCFLYFQNLVD